MKSDELKSDVIAKDIEKRRKEVFRVLNDRVSNVNATLDLLNAAFCEATEGLDGIVRDLIAFFKNCDE